MSIGAVTLVVSPVHAQKDKGKKPEPKVALCLPLGMAPGQVTKFTIRGLELDKATAIHFASDKVQAKILGKGKADVPDKNPQQVGDTQIMVEVMLPKDLSVPELSFEVDTTAGKTKPHKIMVENNVPITAEKEPNDGFKAAQKVVVPATIDGTIDRLGDVDVFAIDGKAGQKLSCEVFAQRFGSALDSMLTLYDANGQQVAFGVYVPNSTDCRLAVTLPKDGSYYLCLVDALDRGGTTYPYRLKIQMRK
jgi:hypothetical protein